MDINMRLLMQYLSQGGQSLAKEGNIAPGLNAVTQQQLGAQSQAGLNERYMKVMSDMIAGNVPEGGKWTSDEKGTKIEIPRNLITGGEVEGGTGKTANQGVAQGLSINTPEVQGQQAPTGEDQRRKLSNPFAIGQAGSISADDLAGLGPEQVSAALTGATNVADLYRQSINDVVNRDYKRALTQQALAPEAPELPFVKDVPGYGDLTLSEYKALPTSDREYASHVLSAREIGEEPMSREEFDKVEDKESNPSTAMAAAIEKHVGETGELPPPTVLANWADMFRSDKDTGPSPVTWTTATKEVTKRFGKLDPTGMWAVTPELQGAHRKAQEYLTDYKTEGVEPLIAINWAEKKARLWQSKVEENYRKLINEAREIPDKDRREARVEAIRKQFKQKYGYLP